MAASPEFYKPAPAAFPAPPCSPPLLVHAAGEEAAADAWEECCRTPTVGGSHLKAPATCPPAPRKPRPPAAAACRKRLFEVELFSVRLEELERLFWPQPPAPREKRRRV